MIIVTSANSATLTEQSQAYGSLLADEESPADEKTSFEVEHIATFPLSYQPKNGQVEIAEVNIYGLPLLVGGVSPLIINPEGQVFNLGSVTSMAELLKSDDYTVTELEILPVGEKKTQPHNKVQNEELLTNYISPVIINGEKINFKMTVYGIPAGQKPQPKTDAGLCVDTYIFNEEGLPTSLPALTDIVKDVWQEGFITTRIVITRIKK